MEEKEKSNNKLIVVFMVAFVAGFALGFFFNPQTPFSDNLFSEKYGNQSISGEAWGVPPPTSTPPVRGTATPTHDGASNPWPKHLSNSAQHLTNSGYVLPPQEAEPLCHITYSEMMPCYS